VKLSPSAWQSLRDLARELGFLDLGAAPARALAEWREPGLRSWLGEGLHGEMGWLETTAAQREDPTLWWPAARTILAGIVSYDAEGEPGECDAPGQPGEGDASGARARVSRYAWGRDYHLVVKRMLIALGRRLEREVPGARWRTCVDRGTAMEKPWAQLAGLGWIGKHGNLLRTDASSWFFIGLLATDLEIDPSEPFATEHCGTCTACIDACPTGAIVAPQRVDARRCISYLTIELEGRASPALREGSGAWVHGCDACQDACPWNRHRMRTGDRRFAEGPMGRGPLLRDLLRLDDAAFTAMTPRSALKREGRSAFVRNAAIAAGNSGDRELVPELAELTHDPSPLVRAHAAWALGRLGGAAARAALERARLDADAMVREEAEAALGGM
jgi:epoxyqueuosine reductase